jgi:hypothetical protein
MTVANSTARTSAVGTNTAGQEIPFLFPVTDSSELVVKARLTSTGAKTPLALTTDYTVSVTGDTGGTVTMVAAWANTYEIWINRDTSKTQTLDLEHGGAFSAENLEDALDKNTKLNINQADQLARAMYVPDTDPSTLDMELPDSVSRASQYLAFSATGEPTVVAAVAPTTATITAWAETLLDDANAAAARTTLGVVIGTDVQAWDTDLDDIAALSDADGNMIVGNGSAWVAESGATLRTSIGCAAATDTPLISEVVGYDNVVVMYDNEIVVYPA